MDRQNRESLQARLDRFQSFIDSKKSELYLLDKHLDIYRIMIRNQLQQRDITVDEFELMEIDLNLDISNASFDYLQEKRAIIEEALGDAEWELNWIIDALGVAE